MPAQYSFRKNSFFYGDQRKPQNNKTGFRARRYGQSHRMRFLYFLDQTNDYDYDVSDRPRRGTVLHSKGGRPAWVTRRYNIVSLSLAPVKTLWHAPTYNTARVHVLHGVSSLRSVCFCSPITWRVPKKYQTNSPPPPHWPTRAHTSETTTIFGRAETTERAAQFRLLNVPVVFTRRSAVRSLLLARLSEQRHMFESRLARPVVVSNTRFFSDVYY